MSTSAERIARGAAYMDRYYPGWERRIDVSTLDISDPMSCVCSQVVAIPADDDFNISGFGVEMDRFHDDRAPGESLAAYGFAYPEDGDTWVTLIKSRFDSGCLSDEVPS